MHLAEGLDGLVSRGLHGFEFADIDLHRGGVEPLGFQFVDGALGGFGLDVGDHDFHARLGERPGHAQAHAAGPASDECDFAFYVFHGCFRPRSSRGRLR